MPRIDPSAFVRLIEALMARTGGEVTDVPKGKGRVSVELQSAGGEKGAEGAYTPTGEPLKPKVTGDIDLLQKHPDAARQIYSQLEAASVDDLNRLARGRTVLEDIQRFGANEEELQSAAGRHLQRDVPLGSSATTRVDEKGVETTIHPSQSLERKPTATVEESLEGNLPQRIDQRLQEFQEPGGYVERVNPKFTLMGRDAIISRANRPTDYDLLRGILKQDYYDLPPGQRFHPEDDPSKFLSAEQIRQLEGAPRKDARGRDIYPEGSLHSALFGREGSNLREHAPILQKLKRLHGDYAFKGSPVTDVIRTGNIDELFGGIQRSPMYKNEGKFFDQSLRFPAQLVEALRSGKLSKASPEVQNYLMRWILNKPTSQRIGPEPFRAYAFGEKNRPNLTKTFADEATAGKAKRGIQGRVAETKAAEDVSPSETNPNRLQQMYDDQASLSPPSMRNLPTEAEEARRLSALESPDDVLTGRDLQGSIRSEDLPPPRKEAARQSIRRQIGDAPPKTSRVKPEMTGAEMRMEELVSTQTQKADELVELRNDMIKERESITKQIEGVPNEQTSKRLSNQLSETDRVIKELTDEINKIQDDMMQYERTGKVSGWDEPSPKRDVLEMYQQPKQSSKAESSGWEKITSDVDKSAEDLLDEMTNLDDMANEAEKIAGVSWTKPLMDEFSTSPSEKLRRHLVEPAVPGYGEGRQKPQGTYESRPGPITDWGTASTVDEIERLMEALKQRQK